MKLTCVAVLIGLVGWGLAAHGAQPAAGSTTGSDALRSTDNPFQNVRRPWATPTVRGAPGRRTVPGSAPVTPLANATPRVDERPSAGPGRDARRNGEFRRARGEPTVLVVFNQPSSIADDLAVADYVNQEVQNYYQPGYDWGAVLKANTVDWGEFIPYLQQYIVIGSPVGQDAFRRGFIAGFGGSAEATYDYALRQACQRS